MEHLLSSYMVTSFSTGWAGGSGSMALKKDDSTLYSLRKPCRKLQTKMDESLEKMDKKV